MKLRQYATPLAFKQALEQRLKSSSVDGVGEPDIVTAHDKLGFAGIEPPTLRLYPVVSHIAEKLHALTMPRSRANTRVRDLPDIALLATTGPINGELLRQAIARTFEFRDTHPVPLEVPTPPHSWEAPYAAMADADALPWTTLSEVIEAVSSFLDPVLRGVGPLNWEPANWSWK